MEPKQLIRALVRNEAAAAGKDVALLSVAGAFAGLLFGFVVYLILAQLGVLDLSGGGWVPRSLAAVWMVGSSAVFCGLLGASEGTLRGANRVTGHGRFRTDVLDRAGSAASSAMWSMDHALRAEDRGSEGAIAGDLDSFLRGNTQLDVAAFLGRLRNADDRLRQAAIARVRAGIGTTEKPDGSGKLVIYITERFLQVVTQIGWRAAQSKTPGITHVSASLGAVFENPSTSTPSSPAAISHSELSQRIVEKAMVPLLLAPIRGYLRVHQIVLAVLLVIVVSAPAVALSIARRLTGP